MNLETVRKHCLSFQDVTEDIKWGNDLCFLINRKMFCVTCLEPPFKVSFKTFPDEAIALCDRMNIVPAPYLARHHWVQVLDENALTEEEWKFYLARSYQLISPPVKKMSSIKKKKS